MKMIVYRKTRNKHIKIVRYRSLGRRKLCGAPYVKHYANYEYL